MSSYKTILKTTSLYAVLRVITIIANIALSKIIAVVTGVSGIGLYGIFSSVLSLITSVTDLGVSKSSIRNIAESNEDKNEEKTSETISLVSRLIFWTGSTGAILTILLSFYISKWSFGDSSYWFSFMLIGVAVFFTVIKNGQNAIFQGLRKYKLISKSTVLSSLLGVVVSIPLIYFFGESGIVYSILSFAVIGFMISKFYLKEIEFSTDKKIPLSKTNSYNIIKLGVAMMLVTFLVSLSGYLIRAFISSAGSIKDVGYFQAGFQIISGYFGIIFTSMATDYFPRISAINSDNRKLEREVNQQAVVSLLLICPLVVVLPYIMPYVISILYSNDFRISIDYVNIALFGIIFQAGSQTMGMILLAKNNAKVFTVSVFVFQTIFLISNIVGYKYYGVQGLGITFSINMFIHLVGIQILNYKLYKISFNFSFYRHILLILIFALLAYLTKELEFIYKLSIGSLLILTSISYSLLSFKKLLSIKSYSVIIKGKLNGKYKKDL